VRDTAATTTIRTLVEDGRRAYARGRYPCIGTRGSHPRSSKSKPVEEGPMSPHETARGDLVETRRVMLVADLAGFARAVTPLTTMQLAALVDRFYCIAAEMVEGAGGRIVKFIGDGCLAIFDESDAARAVDCARNLVAPIRAFGREYGLDLDIGANVHSSLVVEGEFGVGASRRFDIIGAGVIHTFRMGAGPGIRISEPVYRKQPNELRSVWTKRQAPATYTLKG
jgi:class 3 adenylate cyclase